MDADQLEALLDSAEQGKDISEATSALIALLESNDAYLCSNAAWGLQYVVKTRDLGDGAAALVRHLAHDGRCVGNTRQALEAALDSASRDSVTQALDGVMTDDSALARRASLVRTLYDAKQNDFQSIYIRLMTGTAAVRLGATTACIDAGEANIDVSGLSRIFATHMSSDNDALVKESLWAIYITAMQGRPVDPVLDAVKEAAQKPLTEGNAHIILALHDLINGRTSKVEAMLDVENAHINFAAAHAITDFSMRTRDEPLLTRLLWKLPFGITNPSLANGVAASFLAAIKRKDPNGPFAQSVLQKLIASTDDPVKLAPLHGAIQRVNEKLR